MEIHLYLMAFKTLFIFYKFLILLYCIVSVKLHVGSAKGKMVADVVFVLEAAVIGMMKIIITIMFAMKIVRIT